MTTDPTPSPADVRELAAIALAKSICGFDSIPGPQARKHADAVLAAVSPVIRRQERAVVAEEIALAIEELDDMKLSCHWTVGEAAATARDHAPAIARTHAHPEEGK